MSPDTALHTVTELRSATFDLLEATAEREGPPGGVVAEAVDRLQVVANELGRVEELLRAVPPSERGAALRRARRGRG